MKTLKMKANSIILALLIAFNCIGYIQPIKTYALTSQQNELIEKVGTYAREHYDEYKILPSFVVAQALQESAVAVSYHSSGLSSLARVYNNYFGMKCGDGYTGASINLSTGEQTPAGSTYYVSSNFRVFSTFEKGMKGYYEFIYGYSRYHNIIGVTDYKTVCKLIKQDGWATDISYTEGLISKIETFNLTRFDKDLFNKQSFTPSKKSITINASDSEKQTVRFTARNYDIAKFKCSGEMDIADYSITKGFTITPENDGAYLEYTFTAKKPGKENFYVTVIDSNGKAVAETKVTINVVSDALIFKPSVNSISINRSKNDTASFKISVLNYFDTGDIKYDKQSNVEILESTYSPVHSGGYVNVSLKGIKDGESDMPFYLYDSKGNLLSEFKLHLLVTSEPIEIKASSTQITINRSKDETKTITFTDNASSAVTIELASDYEHRPVVGGNMKIGTDTHVHTLTLYGVREGIQNLYVKLMDKETGKMLDKVEIDIEVTNDDLIVDVSQNAVDLLVEKSQTVYVSYKNAPVRFVGVEIEGFSNNNVCTYKVGDFSSDWEKGKIPITITGQNPGNEKITVRLIDSETKECFEEISFEIDVQTDDIIGDINGDKLFNVADVVLLQKWLLGTPDVALADWKKADLCNDDRLDVFDLCLMKRVLLNQ